MELKLLAGLLCALPLAAANRFTPVQMAEARWTRGFWADRFELARHNMIPDMWRVLQLPNNGASFRPLRIAAGLEQGKFQSTNWSDGDVYKWMESISRVSAIAPDAELARRLDEAIAVVAAAQAPDGYISTQIQLTGRKRWERMQNHETYNMGHLITAACADFRARGKSELLAVARKAADHLCATFLPRPPELAHLDFNPSQIMALVDLYRITKERRYLDLARAFVDMRGAARGGTDLNQDRTPLRREQEAEGHAVTATYLWAGATDLYAETGEAALWAALERIWRNVTSRKMYVTGAVGAVHRGLSARNDDVHEAFGANYHLPNRTAYNETCANIGNAMWNWRMLLASGDSRYADVMELVFYNSMLSGMSLRGTEFFYTNVLRRYGDEQPLLRLDTLQRWPDTADRPGVGRSYCCPPNVLRTLAGMHEMAYARTENGIALNLYGGGTLRTREIELEQETNYPWDGRVTVTVRRAPQSEFSLLLRVPAWAEGATVAAGGKPQPAPAGRYFEVRRRWAGGDRVELLLPMETRLIESNPIVEETRNHVAVARGPLVYCVESPDLPPGVRVSEVRLPARARLAARFEPALLGGVTVIETQARARREGDWGGLLYRALRPGEQPIKLRLVPYYAWANRGLSHMTVWIPLAD